MTDGLDSGQARMTEGVVGELREVRLLVLHQPCHSRGLHPRVMVVVVRDDIINRENYIDDVKLVWVWERGWWTWCI
jgi:hypothetical protein